MDLKSYDLINSFPFDPLHFVLLAASPIPETATSRSDPNSSSQPLSSSFAPSPLTMGIGSQNTDDDRAADNALSASNFKRRVLPSFTQFLESNSYYDARGAVAVSLQVNC